MVYSEVIPQHALSIEMGGGVGGGTTSRRPKHSDYHWVHCTPLFSLELLKKSCPKR
jgi:hypothetical protein